MYITGKKARSYVNQYSRMYNPVTLDDVYNSYSVAKRHAWEYCQRKCDNMNGRRLTVLSATNMFFTVAFEYTHPNTGVLMLHVETYKNSYDMEM